MIDWDICPGCDVQINPDLDCVDCGSRYRDADGTLRLGTAPVALAPPRGASQLSHVPSDVPSVSLLGGLRTGDWLDGQTFPPLTYAVPGLLPEGLTLFVGPPKAGKSWFVLDAALALASGGLAFGALHCGDPRDVLLLALEDGDRLLQERCRKLLGTMTPIPKRLHYMTRIPPSRVVDVISEWLDQVSNPGLVVLDTLGKVMPPALPGESAYGRDYRIGSTIKRIADDRPGLAVLVNHHDRKASADDFVDAVSGTNGLAGAADTICVLVRDRQEIDGVVKVTGRDVPEAAYSFTMVDGCAWQLHGGSLVAAEKQAATVAASAGLADRSIDIIAFVAMHPDGVRANEVEQQFGADTRRYLARLTDAGRLTRVGRGLYALPRGASQASQVPIDIPHLGHRDSGDRGIGGPQ